MARSTGQGIASAAAAIAAAREVLLEGQHRLPQGVLPEGLQDPVADLEGQAEDGSEAQAHDALLLSEPLVLLGVGEDQGRPGLHGLAHDGVGDVELRGLDPRRRAPP